MSFSARCLPAVLLTILSLPTSLWAQTTPKQTTKAPRGSVSGRVTIKEKSAAGVVVSLRKTEFMNPYERAQRATTDHDGFYRIANVAPGNYEITPSAPAFVLADVTEPRGRTVLVAEDENIENINFNLMRGGVITGKVVDADGRPVIQQQVSIFRTEAFDRLSGRQPQVYAISGAQTDDRGVYRIFGLPPGRYKVGVGRSDEVFNQSFGPSRSIYKQVFYPDVNDQAKATVIEVGEGTEATNIDIALGRAVQTFAVSGRMIDGEKGLPVPNIRVGLQRVVGQRFEFVNQFATTNSQGNFAVEGLIPGKYNIHLYPNQNAGLRAENLGFDIVDQDLTGLLIKLVPGASLSGVIVIEGDTKAAQARFSELQLRAWVTDPSGGSSIGSSAQSPIAPDGGFSLSGLPGGMVRFVMGGMTGPSPAKGFYVARVERDGVAAGSNLEIKDGEQLTGIRLVLSYGTATVRGVVTVENGTLPSSARFYVRVSKPGEKFSNVRLGQVDARGHFLIEGLAAGMYDVWAAVGGVGMMTREAKREVSVQDGVIIDMTITIDLNALPK